MNDELLVEAEVWTVARTDKGNAVLVKPFGSELAVPIFIGQLEAQSILIGLGKVPMPRPLTHDLFIKTFEHMNMEVHRIEIPFVKQGTFYGKIYIRSKDPGGQELVLDARPSDALGIAVRIACPIFIAESIVESTGVSLSMVSDEHEGIMPSPKELEREKLYSDLEAAIADEKYEEAAKIRDRLFELEDE